MKRKRATGKRKPTKPTVVGEDEPFNTTNHSGLNDFNSGQVDSRTEATTQQNNTNKGGSRAGLEERGAVNDRVEDYANSLPDTIASSPCKAAGGISTRSSRRMGSSITNLAACAVLLQRGRTLQKEANTPHQDPRYKEQELKAALVVIKKVMQMNAAEPFNVPVDPIALGIPDYFDVIDTPMDFGTICSNLENGIKYLNSKDVFEDVQYIWENCAKYNTKGQYILGLMKQVKKNFTKYWTAAGLYGEPPGGINGEDFTVRKRGSNSLVDPMTDNTGHLQQDQMGLTPPEMHQPSLSYNQICPPQQKPGHCQSSCVQPQPFQLEADINNADKKKGRQKEKERVPPPRRRRLAAAAASSPPPTLRRLRHIQGEMSHVADTSNPTSDDVIPDPGSTSRSRVATGYSEVVGGSSVKKLKFNDHGLPVGGKDSAKSSSRLGHLTRAHVPICYISWKIVPTRYKNQLWTAYKGEFPDVKESQKDIFLKKANNAWKKFKVKLRANLVGDDVTKWKELVPLNTKIEDWEQFCNNEAKESHKDLRKRNKVIKESCPTKTTHNTGRDGYARRAEKWKAEHGRYPNRAELWLYTHKQKDGSYAPHDKEVADKVEMLLKEFQESGKEETLDTGPIFETFGKETRGRVRCVGSTISRKAMMASAFAREMLQEVNTDHDDWREKVDSLKEEIEVVKSTVIKFVQDFKSGNFMCGSHDIHTTCTIDATPTSTTTTSTPQFSGPNKLVPCKILSYSGEICGYGRKTQLNVVPPLVHGHRLKPREVRIILDKIKVYDCPLWGGKQASCSTLGDVGIGGFLYWHDDLLPPHDDTDQE